MGEGEYYIENKETEIAHEAARGLRGWGFSLRGK